MGVIEEVKHIKVKLADLLICDLLDLLIEYRSECDQDTRIAP